MKILKPIILVTVLALPGLIFAFLKIFGSNEYEVPIYKKDNYPELFNDCNTAYPDDFKAFLTDASGYTGDGVTIRKSIKVAVLVATKSDQAEVQNQVRRVIEDFVNSSDLDIFIVTELPFDGSAKILNNVSRKANSPQVYTLKVTSETLSKLSACTLLLPLAGELENGNALETGHSLVLIDYDNQVRGFYDESRDEIDRLIMEINIIRN